MIIKGVKIWTFLLIGALVLSIGSIGLTQEKLPFKGVTLRAVTVTGPMISGPLMKHKGEWEAKTGAKIEVIELPWEMLYEKIMTSLITGMAAYDIPVGVSIWMPDFAPYLIPLNKYIDDPKTNPDWEDIGLAFQGMVTWEGNVYGLPLDGDTHTFYYRRSALTNPVYQGRFKQKYGYKLPVPPKTMTQFFDVAEFFTGWDWTGDGKVDYGVALPCARLAQSSKYWFWDFAPPFSVMPGGPDKYRGVLYFDPETMEPLINQPGYVKGLQLYKDMVKFGPPGMLSWGIAEVRSAFVSTGNIALGFAWGAFPTLSVDPDYSTVKGDVGSAPRPGATRVWDRQTQSWVSFSEEEPNYVPVLTGGGWSGFITRGCEYPDAAYDFIRFMNSPRISLEDVTIGESGFNPYRLSHFVEIDYWIKRGFPEQDVREFLAAIEFDLAHPNTHTELMIPGQSAYADAVDLYCSMALAGEMSAKDACQNIYEQWKKVTNRFGLERQKKYYRIMCGLE